MNKLTVVFFGLLCTTVLAFGSTINLADGLTCSGTTLQEDFDSADYVFSGHVISKEYIPSSEFGKFQDSVVQFEVLESFKGISDKGITLTTKEWFWSHPFEEGKDYVVFAIKQKETIKDLVCTRTGSVEYIDVNEIRSFASNYTFFGEVLDGPLKIARMREQIQFIQTWIIPIITVGIFVSVATLMFKSKMTTIKLWKKVSIIIGAGVGGFIVMHIGIILIAVNFGGFVP